MKLQQLTLTAIVITSLVGVTACTNRSASEKHYVRDEVSSSDRSGVAAHTTTASDRGTVGTDRTSETREVYHQPTEIGKMENGTGRAEIVTRKEVIKTETSKATIPTVVEKHVKADINRMNDQDFQQMGLSRDEAASIIRYRHEHGNFASVDELRNVPGMSRHWIGQMRSKLGVSG